MMKNLLVLIFVALGLAACTAPASPDQSSANKDPAQWQQFKSKKGVEELDANTKQ